MTKDTWHIACKNEFVNVMGSDRVLLCTKKDWFFLQYQI